MVTIHPENRGPIREKARRVRLLLTDCDGVLTDARVYYSREGEELKAFSLRDGMGVERVRELAGVEVGIISGENSPSLRERAKKLKVEELHLGVKNKAGLLFEILKRRGLGLEETAYIGDDTNDTGIMDLVGLAACPADAMPEARQAAHYICRQQGGCGAFRELADFIVEAKTVKEASTQNTRRVHMPVTGKVRIGNRWVGKGEPVYIIAEIGINHNGSLDIAKKMIEGAVFAGFDAVKFQKRTPEKCVPAGQWYQERDTIWGRMTYIDYRHRIEFEQEQFAEIDRFCKERGIVWFASCWDEESVDFIEQFDPPAYKVASASLTDLSLVEAMRMTGKPLIVSTGMSTMQEIKETFQACGTENLLIAHTTSAYPCRAEELNLRTIHTLQDLYPDVPIGYSGHEVGLATTWAAVALGACFVERHITLDRSMWGSDQSASIEIMGAHRLVRDIREIEKALGDGIKKVYDSELSSLKKLRRVKEAVY